MGIIYDQVEINLHGFSNSDWASSSTKRKSTSGCYFSLGSRMISWLSKKQSSVALSSAKAEYIATSFGAREFVWLWKILFDLFREALKPTIIHCDNESCIKLSTNPVFHNRSKNIKIPYHYIKDMVDRDIIKLEYINTKEQTADIFTKALAKVKLIYLEKNMVWLNCNFEHWIKISIHMCLCFDDYCFRYVMKGDDLSWTYIYSEGNLCKVTILQMIGMLLWHFYYLYIRIHW